MENNIKENKKLNRIKDRDERLRRLEQDKIDKLCPMCRKMARRDNGKWVKKEIKSYPKRSGNNSIYWEFMREVRNEDRYKDLPHPTFLKEARDEYYEWKKAREKSE